MVVFKIKSTNTNCKLSSQRVDESKLAHLQPQQRSELLLLLDNYADCFSDVPVFCSLAEHTILLLDSFLPKRLVPYKIPIILRPQVEQQLKNFLDQGLIC